MLGLSATTGKPLGGLDHLGQSIRDILTTPIGSRVIRRAYGSRLPQLIDAPINEETIVEIYVATAEALRQWEPRLKLTRVGVEAAAAGAFTIRIEGTYRPDGKPLSRLFQIGGET